MINVGLYCHWNEPFVRLLERMSWSTPDLNGTEYKSLRFVPPSQAHEYALVFNAAPEPVQCPLDNTFVITFEPPEILGDDNAWLKADGHPQAGAHIYSFCGGSEHPLALGLHLSQASIAPALLRPSNKAVRCSMICSDKEITLYQRKRREVMHILRYDTDADIDFFGRGMEPDPQDERIAGELRAHTKDAALRPYTFTIDFENNGRDAITDKFIDPILNATVPITNSPAAAKLFPPDSFEYINFDLSAHDIAERILEIITQPESALERYDVPVRRAQRLLTHGRLNICEWLYREIGGI